MSIIFGINPVLEVLRSKPEHIEKLFVTDGALNARLGGELMTRATDAEVKIERVDKEKLLRLAEGGVHQGVVAEVREFEYTDLKAIVSTGKKSGKPGLVVLLDGIQDPHNLGAIIRSASAFGANGIVIMKDRAAGITGVVMKASAGAVAHIPVARVTNLSRAIEELKDAGYWSVAADPDGNQNAWDTKLDGPLAVVVGAEGAGVRHGVLSHCDYKVRIPMTGQVASLNASVSAGVLLYEIARQRPR